MIKRSYETVASTVYVTVSSSFMQAPVESHSPLGILFVKKRCMNPVHVCMISFS
jgi:hypothetical protein